jgi:general secretion pathway protein K
MQMPRTEAERWKGDGRPHLWEYQGNVIEIVVADESAKIDINTANELLLKGLFRYAGVQDDVAVALIDAILDWRDEDSVKRPRGAEAEDYLAAGKAYTPTNTRFRSIGELRQVLGMNDEIFQRIAGMITVYSGQPGVNSSIASREVLLAIPGSDPAQVDAFIATRETILPGQPKPIFPLAQSFHSGDSNVFSIRSGVRMADGTVFVREAVVRFGQIPGRSVSYLAWRAPEIAPREIVEGAQAAKEQNGK